MYLNYENIVINNSTSIDKTHNHKGKRDVCIPIRKIKLNWKKKAVENNKKASQFPQGEIICNLLGPFHAYTFSDNETLHLLWNKENNLHSNTLRKTFVRKIIC